MLTLDRVYQAAHCLKNVVRKTDLILAPKITNECELYIKTENLQTTGSFKVRGAYFKIASLDQKDKKKQIVACSAGNHAQGVALAAMKNSFSSNIFVPNVAPISKIESTRSYGAQITIVDGVYDDAYSAAIKYVEKTGGIFVHPFDDEDVVAGQGTIGLEILEQLSNMDAVVVPVGGGGLISGVGFVIKMLNPNCKVYGVEAAGADSMRLSLEKNERTSLDCISTFADGIAVKNPGSLTFDMCSKYVDKIVTVTDDEIATAILTLMEKQKLVAEGAGAASVAAVMFDKLPIKGKKVCALLSGGNIDVNILSRVINRGLLTSGRLSDLSIKMLDKPGQLKEVSAIIAALGANVIKVRHNLAGENSDINGCYLHLSLETKNHEHLVEIKNALTNAGFFLCEGGYKYD